MRYSGLSHRKLIGFAAKMIFNLEEMSRLRSARLR